MVIPLPGTGSVQAQPRTQERRPDKELEASLLKIGDNIHKNNVIIAGNFNAPDIDRQNPDVSNRLDWIMDMGQTRNWTDFFLGK